MTVKSKTAEIDNSKVSYLEARPATQEFLAALARQASGLPPEFVTANATPEVMTPGEALPSLGMAEHYRSKKVAEYRVYLDRATANANAPLPVLGNAMGPYGEAINLAARERASNYRSEVEHWTGEVGKLLALSGVELQRWAKGEGVL